MTVTAPRHHVSRPALTGVGMPHERLARVAARRAFVNLKQTYLLAIEAVPGPQVDWLRHQVRQAEEPEDLWLLRAAVFDLLAGQGLRCERDTLQRGIESMFPRGSVNSGFTSFL
jgi:hypothetical protein